MENFKYYLDKTEEIGFVAEVVHSISYVVGLPHAHPFEVVIFETGDIGQVISLSQRYLEILLLSATQVRVGTQVARTGELFKVLVGEGLLGRVINPLTRLPGLLESRPIDSSPIPIIQRTQVRKPLETGVRIVDLTVPLGRGQREIVIGDRKSGKTQFLLQAIYSQANKDSVCIYAAIGQRRSDIERVSQFFKEKGIQKKTIIVATSSSDPAGLIYLTPYAAMTIAEFFRDCGREVLLVLNDLTTHAKYYREITLLAKRFPGRSSYPGDIFYIHSRLLERAGNFKKGSISCLAVAELVLGDLSGYIQTNLMAMTDGHIFFDSDLFNEGRRPAVNPYLSVTRVGHQAQSELFRDLSRELLSFLVYYEKMRQFLHFGAEAGQEVIKTLNLGERVISFFNQAPDRIEPLNLNAVILAMIWSGKWKDAEINRMREDIKGITDSYGKDPAFQAKVDSLVSSSGKFSDLVKEIGPISL